jgi:hypothetical protein
LALPPSNQLGRTDRGNGHWDDLVVVAVQNQSRHVDFLQIPGLIGLEDALMQKQQVGKPAISPETRMIRDPPRETLAPGPLQP